MNNNSKCRCIPLVFNTTHDAGHLFHLIALIVLFFSCDHNPGSEQVFSSIQLTVIITFCRRTFLSGGKLNIYL